MVLNLCRSYGTLKGQTMTQLIASKYHADALSDALLLAYWATTDADRAYHMQSVRHNLDALSKSLELKELSE